MRMDWGLASSSHRLLPLLLLRNWLLLVCITLGGEVEEEDENHEETLQEQWPSPTQSPILEGTQHANELSDGSSHNNPSKTSIFLGAPFAVYMMVVHTLPSPLCSEGRDK